MLRVRRAKTVPQYIEIWNRADSVEDAAKAAGITPRAAITRAARYRRRGVYMKRMAGGVGMRAAEDWGKWAAFSRQFEREGVVE